ncbi:MAG: ATP-binding protein [Marmoricola sp.]
MALVDLAIVARAPSVTWLSALPDALTYPGFAIVITAFLSYVRKVAATADRNTELAAHAMKVAEIERFRLTVHDATGILQLLSSTSTPSSQRPALMRQGTREARRLRAYLAEDYSAPLPSPQSLGEVIQNATEGFNDLPLCLCVELGSTVVLAPRVALGVGRALTTVLHNARRHAEAKTVFVHADCLDGRWELSVRDDGIGFDPSTASFGFGLGTQVIEALQRLEIDVTIDSAPGEGTAVVMVGSAS